MIWTTPEKEKQRRTGEPPKLGSDKNWRCTDPVCLPTPQTVFQGNLTTAQAMIKTLDQLKFKPHATTTGHEKLYPTLPRKQKNG